MPRRMQNGGIETKTLEGLTIFKGKIRGSRSEGEDPPGKWLQQGIDKPVTPRGTQGREPPEKEICICRVYADGRAGTFAQRSGAAVMIIMGM